MVLPKTKGRFWKDLSRVRQFREDNARVRKGKETFWISNVGKLWMELMCSC